MSSVQGIINRTKILKTGNGTPPEARYCYFRELGCGLEIPSLLSKASFPPLIVAEF